MEESLIKYSCSRTGFKPCPAEDARLFDPARDIEKMRAFMQKAGNEDPMSEEDVADYLADVESGDWQDFIIERDGKIIARAALWNWDDKNAEISAVFTTPEYRRQGFGAQVVTACTRHALERGRTPSGTTYPRNTPMIALFEKIGYARKSAK